MKYGKYLEREALLLYEGEEIKEATMMYKILKKYITVIQVDGALRNATSDVTSDRCDLCRQLWTLGPGILTSKCKHSFHPTCIMTCFNCEQSARRCPVCGCSSDNFMPEGFDGEVLQFLSMVRMNVNAVEACHINHMRDLEQKFAWLQKLYADSGVQLESTTPVHQHLAMELQNLCNLLLSQLKLVEFYGWVCYEGIRKIMKKFDKRTMLQTSDAFLQTLHPLLFFRNCCCPGSGALVEMRQQLARLLGQTEARAAAIASDSAPALSPGGSPAPGEAAGNAAAATAAAAADDGGSAPGPGGSGGGDGPESLLMRDWWHDSDSGPLDSL